MSRDWMRESGRAEKEKLADVNRAEELARRDDEAMKRLRREQKVRTPDGWIGFVVEKYPDMGKVAVDSWDRGGTYHASRLTVVGDDVDVTGGL